MGLPQHTPSVTTVIENLEDLSINEVKEQFDIDREQIQAVLAFVERSPLLPQRSC